ncbi:hypothetical protein ACFL6E_02950 [Candidatus Neomarinimicrobiota bacterium]
MVGIIFLLHHNWGQGICEATSAAGFDPWTFGLQAVIAAAAIFAAGWALYEFDKNRKSKRSYLAPSDIPVTLKSRPAKDTKIAELGYYRFDLVNFGNNPIGSSASAIIIVDKKMKIRWKWTGESNNILPNGSHKISTYHFKDDVHIAMEDAVFIRMYVRYRDKILNEEFDETFTWICDGQSITETIRKDRKKLEQLEMPPLPDLD